ncbi:hypothetical protein [Streptacidiphilus sp. EB103A]|uniref:hypothetical protein n=1 Tax=Streptacidiphilus sp. EB103A TaxID=3156275 RepID=UPI003513274B
MPPRNTAQTTGRNSGGPWPRVLEHDRLTYQAATGAAVRSLRAFRTGPGHVTCIVTEQGPGMSVTNAVHQVHQAIQALWPHDGVRVIEHYPSAGRDPEHYDEAFRNPRGSLAWRRVPLAALVAEFGPELPRS